VIIIDVADGDAICFLCSIEESYGTGFLWVLWPSFDAEKMLARVLH
jgi:hypothetical protein